MKSLPSKDKNWRPEVESNVKGIEPFNLLSVIDALYRFLKLLMLEGRVFSKLFKLRLSVLSFDNRPIDDTMGPPIRLPDKSNDVRPVRRPMEVGRVPCSPSPLKLRPVTNPLSHVMPYHGDKLLHSPVA